MRKVNPCSYCGEEGHYVLSCSGARAAKESAKLSVEQFGQLKSAWVEGGVTSAELASILGLPLNEVNAALPAPHYEGYLIRRRKAIMV